MQITSSFLEDQHSEEGSEVDPEEDLSIICLLILSNEQMQTLSSTSPFFPVLQSCRTESVWREEREAELAEKRRAKEMKTPGQ